MSDLDILTLESCESLLRPDAEDFGDHPRFTDEWMEAHLQDAFKSDVFFTGLLNMCDVLPDMVMCQTRIVQTETRSNDMYTLFAILTTPESSGLQPAMRISPVVIVDNYFGSVGDDTAPRWISTRPAFHLRFRLRREHAAELLAALAMAPNNLVHPGLSQDMMDWALYAASGTPAAGSVKCPQTPRKKREPVPVPRRPRKALSGSHNAFV
ncbi:hypothetical protein C8R46DRAFT_1102632, partial [Mycena filopes]